MDKYEKPIPVPGVDSKEFWAACKRHELSIQKCRRCGKYRHEPRSMCPSCNSIDSDWGRVSGFGKVWSYVVFHQVYHPGFKNEIPYVVAIIELDEGVRMLSRVIRCDSKDVHIGMKVRVVFEDIGEEVALPFFEPAVD